MDFLIDIRSKRPEENDLIYNYTIKSGKPEDNEIHQTKTIILSFLVAKISENNLKNVASVYSPLMKKYLINIWIKKKEQWKLLNSWL